LPKVFLRFTRATGPVYPDKPRRALLWLCLLLIGVIYPDKPTAKALRHSAAGMP